MSGGPGNVFLIMPVTSFTDILTNRSFISYVISLQFLFMGNCVNPVARFTEFVTLDEQLFIQSYHHHEQLNPEQYTYNVNPLY